MNEIPRLALTMGDPAGIGPEIAVRAAVLPKFLDQSEIIIYGCPEIINAAAERFNGCRYPRIRATGTMRFDETPVGQVNPACGMAAMAAVVAAAQDALSGSVDAIVTCPMNKASVNQAGIKFSGHTELIAELCGCRSYAMMQSAGSLRVAFVTTHIPLKDVASGVTRERIVEVGELLSNAIKAEGISAPRLAAAALNPHAGENGYMGVEDETVVKPALAQLRQRGINIEGPFPPDTLFIEKIRARFDGILSMYHDQGHIPFKMLAFDCGVNSTLGLPVVRTSVDHGTAFEIAWRGIADTGSLEAALRLAMIRTGKFKAEND